MPYDDDTNTLGLGASAQEELGEEVQKTNTELEKLKRQLDIIEKQKVRLDDLRKRQDELDSGRSEMSNKLVRALSAVEREHEDTQHRLEQLASIQSSFTQHLRYIEAINPKLWGAEEMPKELSVALSAIDDARADYVKAHVKLGLRSGKDLSGDIEENDGDTSTFSEWLKNGFAFTLPLQITLLIFILLWVFKNVF